MEGNMTTSTAFFASLVSSSNSSVYCSLGSSSILCASLSTSLFRLSDRKECDIVVKSVSSDRSSPCHDCARSEGSWLLEPSCNPLAPDGSNDALPSAVALSLRVCRVARSSASDSESDMS